MPTPSFSYAPALPVRDPRSRLVGQAQITNKILTASAKGFQRTSTLQRKYGLDAVARAYADIAASGAQRMRVYGKEAGGIGPA